MCQQEFMPTLVSVGLCTCIQGTCARLPKDFFFFERQGQVGGTTVPYVTSRFGRTKRRPSVWLNSSWLLPKTPFAVRFQLVT